MTARASWNSREGITLRVIGRPRVLLSMRDAQQLARDLSRALLAAGVMRAPRGPAPRPVACDGRKRSYDSEEAARRAHASAGFRVRVYRCEPCNAYHVGNAEKNQRPPGARPNDRRTNA